MAKAGTFINYGEIATTFDCRPVQNRVVFGPPLLDTQVKRGSCSRVFALLNTPLISSALQFFTVLSVYFYCLQWEFHSFQGFSRYSYAHLPSSLPCLVNVFAISVPICSNWRIAPKKVSGVTCSEGLYFPHKCDLGMKVLIAVRGKE